MRTLSFACVVFALLAWVGGRVLPPGIDGAVFDQLSLTSSSVPQIVKTADDLSASARAKDDRRHTPHAGDMPVMLAAAAASVPPRSMAPRDTTADSAHRPAGVASYEACGPPLAPSFAA